jgi:hypothetical protein
MSEPKIGLGAKNHYARLYQAQKGLCFHCGKPMLNAAWTSRKRKNGYTKEHMFPKQFIRFFLFSGRWNTALAHQPCNNLKSNRLPTEEELIRFRELLFEAYGQSEVDIFDRNLNIINQTLMFKRKSYTLVYNLVGAESGTLSQRDGLRGERPGGGDPSEKKSQEGDEVHREAD